MEGVIGISPHNELFLFSDQATGWTKIWSKSVYNFVSTGIPFFIKLS